MKQRLNYLGSEPAHFAGPDASARNVSGVRGAEAALWCEARGDAPLALHWTHRGVKLDLDSFRLLPLIICYELGIFLTKYQMH